ncbi:hypothetical protein NQ318_013342 [Aromia moschata]|uniref:Protein hairless n=1 Tax=Aromia moschata TaxID=1265417 RepID=A0AAV8XVX1_9CUCU|nr:hypothetical protein NQ318_013342 [Aromia moschata]
MHISEFQPPQNTILTKCSKMTEEGHRLHGMNGNADRNIKEECHKTNYGQGGRLKFFKDGKFILELERAREGERVSWVSVPRKTFWPPQGTASTTPAYRQESSTSLSGKLKFKNTVVYVHSYRCRAGRSSRRSRKRRSPYSSAPELEIERTPARDKKRNPKRSLLVVVQSLIDKNFRTSNTAETGLGRTHAAQGRDGGLPQEAFPPRDGEGQQGPGGGGEQLPEAEPEQAGGPAGRCPAGHAPSSASAAALPAVAVKAESPAAGAGALPNGSAEEARPPRNCSYSITSLLAEDRNATKRSPSNSPSHYSPAVAQPPVPVAAVVVVRGQVVHGERRQAALHRAVQKNCGGYQSSHYPPHHQTYLGQHVPVPPVPPYYGAGVM